MRCFQAALCLLFAGALVACFESGTTLCSGDVVCPAGLVCTADGMGCTTPGGCGDGDVGAGEECDDGNQNDEDDCTASCRRNVCGDGHLDMQGDETEECDVTGAPDTEDCDGSSQPEHACTTARCGDGYTNTAAGEVCDDGNNLSGDGCKADCSSAEECGNDIIDSHLNGTMNCEQATVETECPEVCDDNNNTAGDGCSPNCLSDETCGNGIRDAAGGPGNPPEQCDDGDPNDATCSDDCQGGVGCGNGLIELLVGEQCDNGMMNTNTDDCDNDCSLPQCGDNIHNMPAGELCDPGMPFRNVAGCDADCTLPACGDGHVNRMFTPPGGTVTEQCDDGGTTPGDGCSATCQIESCGNNVTEMINGEQCDDGNTDDLDGCRNNCQLPRCGDGIASTPPLETCDTGGNSQTCNGDCTVAACGDGKVNNMFTPAGGAAPESCDDGNTTPGDGCSALCRIESCGNGIEEPLNGEECDDGNTTDTDACRNNCQDARCGDAVTQMGVETCDEGGINTDACDYDCTAPMCNDTIVNIEDGEQCEDGNTLPGDGCSPTCRLEPFPLTVVRSGSGNGTVTSTPGGISCGNDCSELYLNGTMVTLSAAPSSNATFEGWSGGGCVGTGTCVVTMDAAKTVTATFALNTLSVMKLGTGSGTVTSNPAGINCGADCDQTYNTNTQVTLSHAASSNSTFTGWSGGGCSGTGTCVVDLDAATLVTATFMLRNFTMTVNRSGNGTGNVSSGPAGIDCGGTCTFDFTADTVVTLTASPAANSTFTGWSGSGCSGTGQCVVTMSMARSVTADFTLKPFTLTVTRQGTNATGTVTSMPSGINCGSTCSAPFNAGTVVTLTAVPNNGDAFIGWSGGGCSGTGTCVVTVDAATSVTASFAENKLTVVRSGDGAGTVTSNPSGINCGNDCTNDYNVGTDVTLTAVAAGDARFTQWTTGPCAGSTTNTCLVDMLGPVTVTAEFVDVHVLTLNKGAGSGVGTVTSSPAGIDCNSGCSSDTHAFDEDTVVTLTAAPGASSYFIGWSGSGCSGTGTCMVTMSVARTVTANFGPTFLLTVTPAGTGTGVVQSAPAGIDCGATCMFDFIDDTNVTLTATPTGGSTFAGWSGSGCTGTGTCLVDMTAARNVTATFNPPPMFALNVTVSGTGTVSSSPAGITACAAASGDCTENYTSGTMVQLTASANATWTGCAMMTMTTCNVTMDMMRAVTATFP